MVVYSIFSGTDLVGEFDTRDEAERALNEAVAADPSAAEELAVIDFEETGERVGKPSTPISASLD